MPLGTMGCLLPRLQADRGPTALEDMGRTPPWEPHVGAACDLTDDRGSYLQIREGQGVPVSDRWNPPTWLLQNGWWPSCLA